VQAYPIITALTPFSKTKAEKLPVRTGQIWNPYARYSSVIDPLWLSL